MSEKYDPAAESKRWMLYALSTAALSWAGLWGVVQLPITNASKTVFFGLLFAAIASTAMPAIAYLNIRFGGCRNQRAYRVRFVRQSVWLGLIVVIAGWLQMRRLLDVTLALILVAVFGLTETFLIMRDNLG